MLNLRYVVPSRLFVQVSALMGRICAHARMCFPVLAWGTALWLVSAPTASETSAPIDVE